MGSSSRKERAASRRDPRRSTLPTLEGLVRRVGQPADGLIPRSSLTIERYGKTPLLVDTGMSRMLASSLVKRVVGYALVGSQATADLELSARCRIASLPAHRREGETRRVDALVSRLDAASISADFLAALAELVVYAPSSRGGQRRYPDGGRVQLNDDDCRVVKGLAKRAAFFVHSLEPSRISYREPLLIETSRMSTAVPDFLLDDTAVRIVPSTLEIPQHRDILLAYAWARCAGVDAFAVYNPSLDVSVGACIEDLPRSTIGMIDDDILGIARRR